MQTFFKLTGAVLMSGALAVSAVRAEIGGVREVPRMIPDLAMATFDAYGPVIYWNPSVAQQVPQGFLKFTRAHEYAHIQLGHIQREMMEQNPLARLAIARTGEIEADKFATDYWMDRDPSVVEAAIQLFMNPGSANRGDHTHLPTTERARLIASWRDAHGKDESTGISPSGTKSKPKVLGSKRALEDRLHLAQAELKRLEKQKEQLEAEQERLQDRANDTEGSVSEGYQRRADAVGPRIERLETRIQEAEDKISKLEERVDDSSGSEQED